MPKTERIFSILIVVFFLAALFGCVESGNYGRLTRPGSDMTIDYLQKHWQNYKVSYAGVDVGSVNAILFDPKGDGRQITLQQFWVSVNDAAKLSELVRWIHVFKIEGPSLYGVAGPGGQVFGYLYMLPSSPLIKVVDDKTLWIGNLSDRSDDNMGAN